MRKVSNLLQASASLSKEIDEEMVYDVASKAKPEDVKKMLESAMKGNFLEARKQLQDLLLRKGLSGNDIISEIHRQIFSLNVPDDVKMLMIEKCGEYEFRLSSGGNELIQLSALIAQFLNFIRR